MQLPLPIVEVLGQRPLDGHDHWGERPNLGAVAEIAGDVVGTGGPRPYGRNSQAGPSPVQAGCSRVRVHSPPKSTKRAPARLEHSEGFVNGALPIGHQVEDVAGQYGA